MEIELRRLIGHQVVVVGPTFIDSEKLHSVKLLAVEEAGIWIASQKFDNTAFLVKGSRSMQMEKAIQSLLQKQ